MNFLKNIGKSIYGPEYYAGLQGKTFGYSFVYLLKLLAIISLIGSIVATFYLFRVVNKYLPEFFDKTSGVYPAELVITVEKGEIKTNVSEPYKIPLSAEVMVDLQAESPFAGTENLIVFNTGAEADLAMYREFKTLVLVGKHDIIMPDDNGAITVQSIREMPDFVLDKGVIDLWVGKLQSWLKFIVPLALLVIFPLSFIFMVSWNMSLSLFWALVVWLVATLRGVKIGYGKAHQLTLHVITSLILLNIFRLFIFDPKIPFLSLIIVILIAAINITKSDNVSVVN